MDAKFVDIPDKELVPYDQQKAHQSLARHLKRVRHGLNTMRLNAIKGGK